MRRLTFILSLVLSTVLVTVGCMAPQVTHVPSLAPNGEQGTVGYFEQLTGTAAIAVRLIDKRQTVQGFADAAGQFNGVRFELSNPDKLKVARREALGATGGAYGTVFSGLPSDEGGGYVLTAELYRNVTTPTSLDDSAYANLDNKVGEGHSAAFSLEPGKARTVTLVINAVGTIGFSSSNSVVDPVNPTFDAGDATAAGLLSLSKASNPDATAVTYKVVTGIGSTVASGSLASDAWATLPTQTRLPFTAPAAGNYRLVVELVNGARVLSRRSQAFAVKAPVSLVTTVTVAGGYPNLTVNGQPFEHSWYTTFRTPATGSSTSITFHNHSTDWVWLSYSGDWLELYPGESQTRTIPVVNGEIVVTIDFGP
jgi:hypothetical protein